MENPQIAGVEYQQGTLAGYEVREYLLEKFGRCCVYCGATEVPLNLDHVKARASGGSDRVSNLVTACRPCNEEKGAQSIEEFLKDDPVRLAWTLARLKAPLLDAAAVNATRWALWRALSATGLPVESGSGGRTKWNRSRLGIPKTHALDAVCVGKVATVEAWDVPPMGINASGRGTYCRTRLNAHGFPRGHLIRRKSICGFKTGDMATATVPAGKKAGIHSGRISVRASRSFNVETPKGVVQGIHARHFTLIQRGDGYAYTRNALPPRPEGTGFPREESR
jgi:hypothetical protein